MRDVRRHRTFGRKNSLHVCLGELADVAIERLHGCYVAEAAQGMKRFDRRGKLSSPGAPTALGVRWVDDVGFLNSGGETALRPTRMREMNLWVATSGPGSVKY